MIIYGEYDSGPNKFFYYAKVPMTSSYVYQHLSNTTFSLEKIRGDDYEMVDGSFILGSSVSVLISNDSTSDSSFASYNLNSETFSEVKYLV